MSRPRFPFVVTLISCLLLRHAALAGINFASVPPVDVGPHPEFMAAGDLNNDGRTDVVVVSPTGKEIDTFIAADTPAKFAPAQVLTIDGSRRLRGLALGDLNADNRLDVVVTDQAIQTLWILLGRGDGTFSPPFQITLEDSRRPVAVAIANFDGTGNPDLAVTDDRLGKVFILINDNGNPPGFLPSGDIDVGAQPDDIRAVDLNRDGRPDILTLNLGGPRVKELAVLLWRRVIDGFPEFSGPQKFTVGERPSDLVIADFNTDDNPDVAMLNRPSGTNQVEEIDVLLGQGNGVFFPPIAQVVPCPFFTGGAPCRTRALAAGDFDGNGVPDLMVALTDPRSIGNMVDQMQAFGGRGDGTFVPGGLFSIGKNPFSMAAADITGDGQLDIAVATQADLNLQAFVNVSTGGDIGIGDPCQLGEECLSNRCTNGVCCAGQCGSIEVCNVPGREGTCVPIPPVPTPCTLPDQPECETDPPQFCVDGFCCDQLCIGGHCNRPGFLGVCIPGIPDGQPCSGDDQECSSNHCSENFICCHDECKGAVFCDSTGVCHEQLDLGAPCQADEECISAVCDAFDAICCNRRCAESLEKCYIVPGPLFGRCVDIDLTEPPTPTPTPTLRLTPAAAGTPCRAPSECGTGFCVNEVCCTVDSCPADQHCEKGTGVCVFGALTPTPTPFPTPFATLPTIDPCGGGCRSGERCEGGQCITVNQSSGCSTADDEPARGNLAVVALLPLALWVSRRWQLHRAQVHRRTR